MEAGRLAGRLAGRFVVSELPGPVSYGLLLAFLSA